MTIKWMRVRRRRWGAAESALYSEKEYNGVNYEPYGHDGPVDLSFLSELPGLAGVWLSDDSEVTDDSAVFAVPGLSDVYLEHRAKAPLRFDSKASSVIRLITTARKGVETLSHATSVEDLSILGWGKGDTSFASGLERLRRLTISQRRKGELSFRGLRSLPTLREVQVEGGSISELDALPVSVTDVELTGVRGIDLSFVQVLPQLQNLTIERCGSVPTLQPLVGHPGLRGIDLTGTTVDDGDRSPLSRVPLLESVELPRSVR